MNYATQDTMMGFAIFLFVLPFCNAVPKLGRYNVDPDSVSVSGISGGAGLATNFHVVHSESIVGMASFAGVPYWCPMDQGVQARSTCMNSPSDINIAMLISKTQDRSEDGDIDDISNLQGSKVVMWHGDRDTIIRPGASEKMVEYYEHFGADIAAIYMDANHGQPTYDYGVACTSNASPYIIRCEYDGAFHALNHIYGGTLQEPDRDVDLAGTFSDFDQSDFANTGSFHSDGGFIYVPSGCQAKDQVCKLHVAFHGCLMSRQQLGDVYARHSGYLEVGELNNIIMLFPQIVANPSLGNQFSCFDWWGYDPKNGGETSYATKTGVQISSVKAMIDHIMG